MTTFTAVLFHVLVCLSLVAAWRASLGRVIGNAKTALLDAPISSPFAAKEEIATAVQTSGLELSVANVERVLDEVRPYLQADGGNVAVYHVDTALRNIQLVLEGACGSCPSSTTTMKMGIERVLRENFIDLNVIEAVDPNQLSRNALSKELIEKFLEKVLPAIKGMGGSLEIKRIDSDAGTVVLGFDGPSRLQKGIQMVLKDHPAIKQIVFEELTPVT